MVHPQSLSVSLRHCFIFHYFVPWRLATGDCATCTLSLADFGLSLASGGVSMIWKVRTREVGVSPPSCLASYVWPWCDICFLEVPFSKAWATLSCSHSASSCHLIRPRGVRLPIISSS